MRVALYEATRRDDVPAEVALDEAVSLAREYCGAEAPGLAGGFSADSLSGGAACWPQAASRAASKTAILICRSLPCNGGASSLLDGS